MERSERMQTVYAYSAEKGTNPPQEHFTYDMHKAAIEKYAHLPRWEKIARSTADAIVNQDIIIEPFDKLIGRTYYNAKPIEKYDPDFNHLAFREEGHEMDQLHPGYREFESYNLVLYGIPGHIAWDWNRILKHGTIDIRRRCEEGLIRRAGDTQAEEFYRGALIMLDALEAWNDKHVEALEKMGMTEEAEICRRVPRYPARNFHEAVQSYFMQHIVVMKECPHGGNSPGRLDYYLWPFLEQDLKDGSCTMEEAQELVEELFLRIDERIHRIDTWGETVVLGGSHPDGSSAINPLSYIMINAFMKYDITHPYFYPRFPKDCPQDFIDLSVKFLKDGNNRAQVLNDTSIMNALTNNGVSDADAANYYCGGCMEVSVQGATSDLLFAGWHNMPKILEFCMTGGKSLTDGKTLQHKTFQSLRDFDCFEDFYQYYITEAHYFLRLSLQFLDLYSESLEKARPAYLISTMVNDCIARGRAMQAGGARYHNYGAAILGIPNAADSLYAVKRAVFEDKICSVDTLLAALEANFVGYEELRKQLLALPKYGQEHAEADALAKRLSCDLVTAYRSYVNRFGGNGEFILLTFAWAPVAGRVLGATPDGRLSGTPVAQAITPQSMSMTNGITAAINSCTTQPFELFAGAASSMWDLDPSWATEDVIKALLLTFFEQGGQIFQGNTTDVAELIEAQKHPEDYGHLIVRVGGFSARFVGLDPGLQTDIINRRRHKG